jgi:hypothetical protein
LEVALGDRCAGEAAPDRTNCDWTYLAVVFDQRDKAAGGEDGLERRSDIARGYEPDEAIEGEKESRVRGGSRTHEVEEVVVGEAVRTSGFSSV